MEITVQQVELLSDDDYIYLDVRGEIAYQHGHIPKAYEWAGDFSHIEELPKDKRLIVYCNYGEKSAPIAEQLRQEGYEALNLSGGYREWLLHVTSQKEQMQDVSKDGLHLFSSTEELTPDEVKRYDRQIILPQVGSDGQKKLKKSKVLIIGAGGLGAPAALYLAGAGVGTIGIVDADDVSVSNLQRQIIHTSKREGTNKAESAKKSMLELNEHIKVNTYPEYLYADNAEELFKEYDFIIDAVDNFETKFLINDTCVLLKKPFCHAGILQFQGQVMTYVPEEDQPCYRCIFEEIPESGSVPNCSQAGIIGAVAGIIGCTQSTVSKVIKESGIKCKKGRRKIIESAKVICQTIHTKKEEKQKAKVHKEMEHLLETNPEFCTTMDKLNELKKKRERYRKEKEELNERRKNAGMEPDFCSTV